MSWEAPSDDTLFYVTDVDDAPDGIMTYSDMTEGIETDLLPADKVDFDTLLWCFGAEQISD